MLLIILEVRSEYLARIAMAAWALLIYIVDPNAEWPYTNFASAVFLALALLLIELNFTPSFIKVITRLECEPLDKSLDFYPRQKRLNSAYIIWARLMLCFFFSES